MKIPTQHSHDEKKKGEEKKEIKTKTETKQNKTKNKKNCAQRGGGAPLHLYFLFCSNKCHPNTLTFTCKIPSKSFNKPHHQHINKIKKICISKTSIIVSNKQEKWKKTKENKQKTHYWKRHKTIRTHWKKNNKKEFAKNYHSWCIQCALKKKKHLWKLSGEKWKDQNKKYKPNKSKR